jgi:hypothetical protein
MLFLLEMKKVLFAPAIIGFVILCLVVNIIIVLVSYHSYDHGGDYGQPPDPVNVFEGYDASSLADSYVARYGLSGSAEENVRAKYAKLQPVIDEKARNGDALSLYLGQRTNDMHDWLFGGLFLALTAEGCLIALFAALLLTGYENTRHTEQLVCSTRIGRNVMRTKLAAALVAGLALFASILIVSLAAFFICHDFSSAWDSNVSSSFNSAYGEHGKPFITWHSFTVTGLLGATTGMAMGLTVVFTLLGFAIGTFVRNGYASCLVAVVLCVLQLMAVPLFPIGGVARSVLNLMPAMLWANVGRWFTDGGVEILWANFECVGLTASLIALTAASVIATKQYRQRELRF